MFSTRYYRPGKRAVRAAAVLHCQCCGREILANTGTIAHHGYERPGLGWQTSSCWGAKKAPFEVSRDALGSLLSALRDHLDADRKTRQALITEKAPVPFTYTDYAAPRVGLKRPNKTVLVTRENFNEFKAELVKHCNYDFDTLLKGHLRVVDHQLVNLEAYIREQQDRYDGWKQTHRREGKAWVAI